MRMYRDGVETDTASDYMGYGPWSSTLRMGATNPNGTFTGHFLIDDARISDVALLPGDGLGDGVLAWNTSLSEGPAALLGDANNDDQVTGGDLISVQQNFGTDYTNGECDGLGTGDANNDCLVTGGDLIAVQQNFGKTAGMAAVPEPAASLATLLILFLSAPRSR